MESTEGLLLTVLAGLALLWLLVARRVRTWQVTAPIAFVVAGVVLYRELGVDLGPSTVLTLAEITLVVILFHDASTVQLAALRKDPVIALRLLLIGFPLALAATFALSWAMLPAAGLAGAALLAGALTPTDAGLGAPTILDPHVPVRVRRALNVESGLNDGLATPVVLLSLAALSSQVDEANGVGDGVAEEAPTIFSVGAVPVALGVVIGIGLGLIAAWGLDRSRQAGWSDERGRSVAVAAIPVICLGLAEITEANAFITAFVCGLVFGRAAHCVAIEPQVSESVETVADVLGFLLWFLAGGLITVVLVDGIKWQWVVIALGALTVLRIGPVWVSMLGSGFRPPTVLFLGWFGPRGLASIVFALLAVEELGESEPVMIDIAGVIALTVMISVVAHGVSAGPLAARYGSWAARTHAPIEVEPSVEPMPSRGRRPAVAVRGTIPE